MAEAYNEKIRRLIADLKEQIDLHDLAAWLGMERPKKSGNWRSPHRKDANPSVGIYKGGRSFKDYASGESGSCIDLVMYVRGVDQWDAIKELCEYARIPLPGRDDEGPPREKTRAEFIADQCLKQAELALPYLVEQRKIPEATVRASIKARTIGFNTWASPKVAAGEFGHGGPAAAFIVRTLNPGHVAAVDMRYLDPAANGGVKTQTQGDKFGLPWLPLEARRLRDVRTVYIVESAINALSIEACGMARSMAIAVRGLNVEAIDWAFLYGRQCVICMDADGVNEQGKRPGPEAGWKLYDLLTTHNIAAALVDQSAWAEDGFNDVNEILIAGGTEELRRRVQRTEENAIAGLVGRDVPDGPRRLFLPAYDFAQYWRFKAQADYSDYVVKTEGGDDGDEPRLIRAPLAGFRLAALSRVTIQSERATFSGVEDHSPTVQFAASVQLPRHGPRLVRRVFRDEDLHKVPRWEEFGPVYEPKNFRRLLTIFERSVHLGARKAANFVGVSWLDGKLRVNEGTDCYFEKPEKQCHYHEHVFHRGPASDAGRVVEAFQGTFRQNAAAIPLVWALGAPALKCILGFWPHFEMQAKKGAGKSTLIGRLSACTGFTMFSSEQLKTSYRVISSLGHTSMPVGWEEVSKAGKEALKIAVTMLQEAYQFAPHTRGSDNLRYLNSAPVLLAGEDVPMKDLTGKLVRTRLTQDKQGPALDSKLPMFPMRRWLEWVVEHDPAELQARHTRLVAQMVESSRASTADLGGRRMANNYAAMWLGWKLLAEFGGFDAELGGFEGDLLAEMNAHIGETEHDREPYIWILEKLASEIARRHFQHPYAWEQVPIDKAHGETELCLVVKPQYVMDHMGGSVHLREFYDSLPIKTPRVFKQQCMDAGLVVDADYSGRINDRREWHCLALSIRKLEEKGVSMPVHEPEQPPLPTPSPRGYPVGYDDIT